MSSYSPELMAAFKTYAANPSPTQRPEYKIVHNWNPWIQVPTGCLPIRVAQFTRGQRSDGSNRLYHWAIFIPTSTRRGVGNYYEIGGSLQNGYFMQHLVHTRHPMWDKDERGTHLIGYVDPSYLGSLEARFSLVPIKQGRADWNCQTWVIEALSGLNHGQMYAAQMEYGQWAQQMEILEAAWNVGNA